MRSPTGITWSSRAIAAVVSLALMAVAWIVYFSPIGSPKHTAEQEPIVVTTTMPRSPWTGTSHAHVTPTPKHVTVTKVQVDKPPAGTGAGSDPAHAAAVPVRQTVAACADFAWQQDAQAAYLANLSDPNGLDGPAGPNNGNGIACDTRPVDPARAASTPIDAFSWSAPSAPSKAAIVHPSTKYFGVAADGLPGDSSLFDNEDTLAGRAPNLVEWFQYFGDNFPSSKVRTSWQRGAVPVITWMSAPSGFATASDLSAYSPRSIAAGSQDGYIRAWAAGIAVQGLPVVIRFDHEANGNWYPWATGWSGHGIASNTPADYVNAWRHVWNIFQAYGANSFAIWAYTPSRIDTLGSYGTGLTPAQVVGADYPGDGYVDWVGMDGYQYNSDESSTYSDTFGATLSVLKGLTSKPIYIGEMGSAENGDGVKPAWISQTYAGLAADPSVVAATYFDNDVTGVHYVNGQPVRTNWRIDSSSSALAAFRSAVGNTAFGSAAFPPYLLGN